LLNEEYRRINNLQPGYCFNNFIVEGKVLCLLGEDLFSISRGSIFKIKPEDIEQSHSVKFDNGLQLKALESLSKIHFRGITITEESIRAEMNMTDMVWQTFGRDIMDLVQGVPNLNSPQDSSMKMLLLVGIPGSGKSTVAHRLKNMNSNWVRVNQDDLGSRKACEKLARDSLKKGKSVIIDRCNFDIPQRNVWVKLASEFSITDIRCIHFKIPAHICKQRTMVREDHPTIPKGDSSIAIIDSFTTSFVAPSTHEGFIEIHSATNDEDIELAISKLAHIAQAIEISSKKNNNPRSPTRDNNNPRSPTRDNNNPREEEENSSPVNNRSNTGGSWSIFSLLGSSDA